MVRTMWVVSQGRNAKFETPFTDEQAFEALQKSVEAQQATKFAQSLVNQARFRGLSPKQWVWVHKLATELLRPCGSVALEPQNGGLVGGLQPVLDMLQSAAHHLKYPRVVYRGVRISLAKAPDTMNVTSDERSFAQRVFYGRVSPGGSFHATRGCPAEVIEVLSDLAVDPVAKTAAEGRRTGACCFCARELSTNESLAAGYGPVCAEKYGLPWGGPAGEREHDEPGQAEAFEP